MTTTPTKTTLKIRAQDLQAGDLIHGAGDYRSKFHHFGGHGCYTTAVICGEIKVGEVPITHEDENGELVTTDFTTKHFLTVDRES